MHLFLQVMHVQIWKSEVGTKLSNVLTVHVLTGVSVCKIRFPIFGKYNSIKILTSYSPSNIPTKTNKNPLKSHPSTFHGGMRILLKSGRCVEFGMRLVSHGQWISSFPSRGGRKFWRAKKEWCEWCLKGDSYKEGWRWYEKSVFQCGSKRRKDVRRVRQFHKILMGLGKQGEA